MSDIVKRINEAGLLVASAFQTAPEEWAATLRRKDSFSGRYGYGDTLEAALEAALLLERSRKTEKDWDLLKGQKPVKRKSLTRGGSRASNEVDGSTDSGDVT